MDFKSLKNKIKKRKPKCRRERGKWVISYLKPNFSPIFSSILG